MSLKIKRVIWGIIIALIAWSTFSGLKNAWPDYQSAKTGAERFVAVLSLLYGIVGAATLITLIWNRKVAFYFACLWSALVTVCSLLAIVVFAKEGPVWAPFFAASLGLSLTLIPLVTFIKKNP
jgi:hypothetical protein